MRRPITALLRDRERICCVLFASSLFVLMACGPIGMIPGGALSGAVEPVPSDWSFSDEIETFQLETRPSDPYSVNVWAVGVGDRFFIAAARASNSWAEHIADDPRVRVRIGEAIYELRAVRTDTVADLDAFQVAAKRKYDFEAEPEQISEAALFRLEAR